MGKEKNLKKTKIDDDKENKVKVEESAELDEDDDEDDDEDEEELDDTVSEKKEENKITNYAFLEFGDAEECKNAKNKLATTQFKGKEIYVDFVGENSVAKKKTGDKEKTQLNPTRLFVCGLAHGITKANLKEMFPKAANADIPQKSRKKGTSFGFVQFSTPADAKAAFDAAQNLEVNGHRITVLFAKMTETKPEVQKKKAEKRKAKKEEKEKNLKKTKIDDKENKVKVE